MERKEENQFGSYGMITTDAASVGKNLSVFEYFDKQKLSKEE